MRSILSFLLLLGIHSCIDFRTSNNPYQQLDITVNNYTPTVDIKNYTLISQYPEDDKKEAMEILEVKRKLPLAMQRKDEKLFDSILAKNFSFRAEDEFYNRSDYIHNRTTRNETILSAHYENLVLQVFDEVAILSYRNVVESQIESAQETSKMNWADVYVQENGTWKLKAIHLIEFRKQ